MSVGAIAVAIAGAVVVAVATDVIVTGVTMRDHHHRSRSCRNYYSSSPSYSDYSSVSHEQKCHRWDKNKKEKKRKGDKKHGAVVAVTVSIMRLLLLLPPPVCENPPSPLPLLLLCMNIMTLIDVVKFMTCLLP